MRRGSPWYDYYYSSSSSSSSSPARSKRAQAQLVVVVSAAGKKLPWPSPRRRGSHVVAVPGLFFLFRFVAPLLPDPA
jgi:hypothetical protein|uniref:Uncharacterized protein n=1 Tax=Oryza nivara TaxID=4536 RepID=A0A0E0IUN5_ORYNI